MSTELPTEELTFRWVDSGDDKAPFFRQYFADYQKEHPNVTVEYDPLPWEEINTVVPLGVQNGNAHDVFVLPGEVSAAVAVSEGWVLPLNDLIPDFEEWRARFPDGHFVDGMNVFDGKVYGFPIGSGRRYSTLTLYNVEYLERAGYNPEETQLTWDDFRAAARKVTQDGDGEYYGLVVGGGQVGRWGDIVGSLAQMAGAGVTPWQGLTHAPIDWRSGEYRCATDEHLAALDLILAIRDDGSISPDATNLNDAEARAVFPNGAAGMILQGPWCIPMWQTEAPDFRFGVASQPTPDAGSLVPLSVAPGGNSPLWVFSGSAYPSVAGDMFAYLGSEQGQREWARAVGIGNPPALADVLEGMDLDAPSQRAKDIFDQQLRLRPEPRIRNAEVGAVLERWQPVTPNFGETIQGVYAGQLEDPRQALQEVEDRYNAELDRAIAAAQEAGAKVSREDWVFEDWDPMSDYLVSD